MFSDLASTKKDHTQSPIWVINFQIFSFRLTYWPKLPSIQEKIKYKSISENTLSDISDVPIQEFSMCRQKTLVFRGYTGTNIHNN